MPKFAILGQPPSVATVMACKKFSQKLADTALKKLGQSAFKSVPVVGALAGVVGGAVGAVSNYWAVKGTGLYAMKMYGCKELNVTNDDSYDKAMLLVALLVAQADGELDKTEKDAAYRVFLVGINWYFYKHHCIRRDFNVMMLFMC